MIDVPLVRPLRKRAPLAALVAVVLTASACGSSTATSSEPVEGPSAAPAHEYGQPAGSPELSAVNVAVLPLVDFSAIYYAQEKGFFAAEGLEVSLQPVQGAAAAVPGLQSGELQFSIANLVSFVLATGQGLDLRLIADGTTVTEKAGALVVPANSPIQQASDLEGKTVAVNLLKSIGDLTTKAALDAQGVDYKKLRFVELPFPEMVPALQRGSVDAAFLVEPFLSQATAAIGVRTVVSPYTGPVANLPAAGYMTTAKFAGANPKTVAAFQRALEKAATELQDEAVVREFLPTFTQVPAAAAQRIALPTFKTGLSAEGAQRTADLMERYELIPAQMDMTPFVGNR